ncbi:hypothetical protein NE663_11040, partial [Massilicoli timonensis]
ITSISQSLRYPSLCAKNIPPYPLFHYSRFTAFKIQYPFSLGMISQLPHTEAIYSFALSAPCSLRLTTQSTP